MLDAAQLYVGLLAATILVIATNAGVIGAPTGYFSAPVLVRAESVGGATIANSGQIYGDVAAAGVGERRDVTIVATPASATGGAHGGTSGRPRTARHASAPATPRSTPKMWVSVP